MKKVLIITFVIVMVFSLTACDNKAEEPKSEESTESTTPAAEAEKEETATEPESDEATEITFESFEQALATEGLQAEPAETFYQTIGATNGFEYAFADGSNVEVYQFDTASDEYKAIQQDGLLEAPTSISGDLVLIIVTDGANAQTAKSVFEAL